jgi:tRNA threonylcarbamoyl adenosine modification protein (Sua5/YciO/YrdC/YwlC family)
VPSADRAWELAEPNPAAHALARAFWPGPLTLVLPRTPGSQPWHLGDATGTIAVRVPDHPVCRSLLARTRALAATSANLSGHPPLAGAQPLLDTFGEEVAVYLVLPDDLPPPAGFPSTVVDLTGSSPQVTREGPLTPDDLARVLNAEGG